jgi:hypothetical protein
MRGFLYGVGMTGCHDYVARGLQCHGNYKNGVYAANCYKGVIDAWNCRDNSQEGSGLNSAVFISHGSGPFAGGKVINGNAYGAGHKNTVEYTAPASVPNADRLYVAGVSSPDTTNSYTRTDAVNEGPGVECGSSQQLAANLTAITLYGHDNWYINLTNTTILSFDCPYGKEYTVTVTCTGTNKIGYSAATGGTTMKGNSAADFTLATGDIIYVKRTAAAAWSVRVNDATV